MNTTPSIFNEKQLNCVILGGRHPDQEPLLKVAAILLNSGNRHKREQILQSLTACRFEKIISIENDSKNYNLEDFAQAFPHVKFIIPLDHANDGDLVNLAVSEAASEQIINRIAPLLRPPLISDFVHGTSCPSVTMTDFWPI